MIKAIIFDVDGVLFDSFEANFKFYEDLFNKAGYIPPTRKEYPKLFHLPMMDVIKKYVKTKNEKEINRVWKIGKYKAIYLHDIIKTPKELKIVIKKLKKEYLLGIVTSRVKGGLFKIKNLKELKNYFNIIVYYDDTKNHKPHPEPLFLACKKLKIKPNEAIYIGDAESDIKAAKNAGMKIIFYSKKKHKEVDAQTFLFNKLPEIISSL